MALLAPRAEDAVACKLCPDVVEWCPADGLEHLLAWGTYEHQESGERRGELVFATLEQTANAGSSERGSRLRQLSEVESAGVYDIAWAPPAISASTGSTPEEQAAGQLLATACADGTVRLYSADGRTLAEPQVLCPCILTHLCWGAGRPSGLAVVGQDGGAHHMQLREDGAWEVLARRQQHKLETWCVEVSSSDQNLVLTGADDSCLIGWDLREPPDAAPAFVNRRAHEAGVTALACDPLQPHRIATGSYDERVRLFDLRMMSGAPVAESDRLDDGAYHLAWHPAWPDVLAVANMRSGFPLLSVKSGESFQKLTSYGAEAPEGAHGSLGYGIS
ncbi:unnamed protein product [Polarella glacialis]|uniref:methylated diphthine methylhydrolase n=2 Tax=Polarella glacialis TaxID=89957 RepID=A0A813L6M7_POLGL|nr:unnamed protein product [Polarella glacialis]